MFPPPSYESYSYSQTPSMPTVPDLQLPRTDATSELQSTGWFEDLVKFSLESESHNRNRCRNEASFFTSPGLGFDTSPIWWWQPNPPLSEMQHVPSMSGYRSSEWFYNCYPQSNNLNGFDHGEQWSLPTRECLEPPQSYQNETTLSSRKSHNVALTEPLTDILNEVLSLVEPTPQFLDKPVSNPLSRQSTDQEVLKKQKSRTNKRSYNPKTMLLLNELFFDTIGNNRKPTKVERRYIEKKTGISSRRLTYWLANHKRRLKPELKAYRRLCLEGEIYSYDSFVEFCSTHVVPELKRRRIPMLHHCSSDDENDMLSDQDNVDTCDDQ